MKPPHVNVTLTREVPFLPPRAQDANKGSYGRVLIVAGGRGMSGAAVLCGSAALRGGAGLVRLAVPEGIVATVASANPCYLTLPLPQDEDGFVAGEAEGPLRNPIKESQALVVGPGLGKGLYLANLLTSIMAQCATPMVLDADALNTLAAHPGLLGRCQAPTVLTPHPGEFARLIRSDIKTVQAARQDYAASFAAEHGVVMVLKGAGTVVSDGKRLYINDTGNPGMATGGTGDVLTGLIGALLAQHLPAFEAAVLGVYLHGLAGDLARDEIGEVSLIASDLLTYLPKAFRNHDARRP